MQNSSPVIAVERSDNAKIGRASATYVSQASCPAACPFMNAGCYAESGLMALHTRRLNASNVIALADIADAEAAGIRGLTGRHPLRLHVVGDCTTDNTARIVSDACGDYSARHGSPVWTYTHAWRDVERASWQGVSVLASCETGDDIRDAQARGYATAVVYDAPAPAERPFQLDGAAVIPCPNQKTGRPVKCTDCRLCWRDSALAAHKLTIGFHTHGSKAKVRESLRKRVQE